jgi:hypothetical protein
MLACPSLGLATNLKGAVGMRGFATVATMGADLARLDDETRVCSAKPQAASQSFPSAVSSSFPLQWESVQWGKGDQGLQGLRGLTDHPTTPWAVMACFRPRLSPRDQPLPDVCPGSNLGVVWSIITCSWSG